MNKIVKGIARYAAYGGIGFLIAKAGYHVLTFEFWLVLGCIVAIDIIRP